MKQNELKDFILQDPILSRQFDMDSSNSIEKDEYDWFIRSINKILNGMDNSQSRFKVMKDNKMLGTAVFSKIHNRFKNDDIYISLSDENCFIPLPLISRISKEGIQDEQEDMDDKIYASDAWYHKDEMILFNASSQRRHYSGIIKDTLRDVVIARISSDSNYINSLLFLTIAPDTNYSNRRNQSRKYLTARIIIYDYANKPCFEVIVDPGLFKFGNYNVYDRRDTALQAILAGKIKKSLIHALYKGKIEYDRERILVSKNKSIYIFEKRSRIIALFSRIKLPIIDALVENKRGYKLEFKTDASDYERMLIISYALTMDTQFWMHYRY